MTLIDTVTPTDPMIILPELGAVKQSVTLYAPEVGELVAHGLIGLGVAVGVAVAVGLGVGVGVGDPDGVRVAVGVGLGVVFPLE